jgi:hypothetical protein
VLCEEEDRPYFVQEADVTLADVRAVLLLERRQ